MPELQVETSHAFHRCLSPPVPAAKPKWEEVSCLCPRRESRTGGESPTNCGPQASREERTGKRCGAVAPMRQRRMEENCFGTTAGPSVQASREFRLFEEKLGGWWSRCVPAICGGEAAEYLENTQRAQVAASARQHGQLKMRWRLI